MMQFARTLDLDLVQKLLTHPKIYSLMGDDSLPPREQFEVNRHPAIQYVTVSKSGSSEIIGIFMLCPENTVCWQLHIAMLPWAKTEEKWAAAREFIPWLKDNTGCRRLTAAAPSCNQRAVAYCTHGLGMHYVGRQEQAFLKFGILHDLILLGRSQ